MLFYQKQWILLVLGDMQVDDVRFARPMLCVLMLSVVFGLMPHSHQQQAQKKLGSHAT